MTLSPNTHYSNTSLLFKILGITSILVLAFVIFHVILAMLDLYPVPWLREIHFILQNGFLPFFLFLTGTFIHNKKLRIPLLIFFPLFFIAYLLKTLDFWGYVDIQPIRLSIFGGIYFSIIKWVLCPALLGLMITYTIHFFAKRKKFLLDYIKVIWFLAIGYVTLSIYFPIGFRTMYLYEITVWILILLMTLGLINFFRKPA